MEHTTTDTATGWATLLLAPDGGATFTLESSLHHASSRGRYAPGGARDESREHQLRRAFEGRWSAEGDGVAVRLLRVGVDAPLPPDAPSPSPAEPSSLRCTPVAVTPEGSSVALASLACELDQPPWPEPVGAAFPLERRPPRTHEPPFDAGRWLLLGATPGLQVRWQYQFRDTLPQIEVSPRPP
jgi:hypothetical protein